MNKFRIIYVYFKTRFFDKFNNRKELIKSQKKQLKKFIYFLNKNSPYYSKLNYDNILKSSTISKKEFMENFDLINTKKIKKKEAFKVALNAEKSRNFKSEIKHISVGLSSGTSGNKGLFLICKKEREIWAGYILAKARINIFARNKIAFFLRANNNLYSTVKNQRLRFKFYDLFEDMEKHIFDLNRYNPSILIAPASVLVMLAKVSNQGSLSISPRTIYSVAEVLEKQDQVFISKTFGVNVGQVYQCTEGFLGITCEHGTLHINEDILIMQKKFIDKKKFKFKPIITDLNRKTQPVIRYELDDILTLKKEKCKCGSALLSIESIEGRMDDIIYLKKLDGKLAPIFPDYFRRIIITTSDLILDYYVEQSKKNLIKIYVEINNDRMKILKILRKNLNDFFVKQNLVTPKIQFVKNKPLLKKGDKKRRIRSKLSKF